MHSEPVGGPQLVTGRRQHMDVNGVFGVEAEGCRSRPEADGHGFTGTQVQSVQAKHTAWWLAAVDSPPHLHESSIGDTGFICRPADQSRQLGGRCYATLPPEQRIDLVNHLAMVDTSRRAR